MSQIHAVARQYAHVLEDKPKEYSNYQDLVPPKSKSEDYSIIEKIGEGTYSDVFSGLHVPSGQTIVLKVLKKRTRNKILKEIKVLQILSGGSNIIDLLDTTNVKDLHGTALVFEMVSSSDFHAIHLSLDAGNIKYCTREILKGLNYCHSMGIMHRDLKPHNIVVNLPHKIVKLIDLGSAQFYRPGQKYCVTVGTRYYKAPELLLNYIYYNYSVDIWSLGCIFADMIFRRYPFFHGTDSSDQIVKIVQVLGTNNFNKYTNKYLIEIEKSLLRKDIKSHERKEWCSFRTPENIAHVTPQACDLINSMLRYDHIKRVTAEEALQHPYFCYFTNNEQKKEQ